MGLLAVIGPSRKEKYFLDFLFLARYFCTIPFSYQCFNHFFSISGKLTLLSTGLNINLNRLTQKLILVKSGCFLKKMSNFSFSLTWSTSKNSFFVSSQKVSYTFFYFCSFFN